MERFSPSPGNAKKKKGDKNDDRAVLVRAYLKRSDELPVAEALVKLGSNGDLAVDYVAAVLRLGGRLRVSRDLCDLGHPLIYHMILSLSIPEIGIHLSQRHRL
jgi:hypothetical protein